MWPFLCFMLMSIICVVICEVSGPPAGLLYECPGMNKTTKLSKKTASLLSVVALIPDNSILVSSDQRCSLNDEGVACVANVLDLKKKKIQVMISGYMDSSYSIFVRTLGVPYLQLGRHLILVELFPILVRSYPIAARMTKPIGIKLGEFLAKLTAYGLTADRMEILGGSLGAHIASFASVRFYELTGHRPARLTGLDPAGPCFRNLRPEQRFNADAAEQVDALHTNMDGLGIADAIAQVDFYANGGEYQPLLAGNFLMPCLHLCSHLRAAYYWVEANISPEGFQGVRCNSIAEVRTGDCYKRDIQTNVLGPNTNFSLPGMYYLPTNVDSPYAKGFDGIREQRFEINNYLLKTGPDEDIII